MGALLGEIPALSFVLVAIVAALVTAGITMGVLAWLCRTGKGPWHRWRLKRLVSELPAGAVIVDGDRIFVNAALEAITGVPAHELTTREQWTAQLGAAATFERGPSDGGRRRRRVEITRRDGERRVLEILAGRTARHEMWLINDVTERQRALHALRASNARLDATVNTAADGIITIDADGLIVSFNPAAEQMFGYPTREVLGRKIDMLMPEPYRSQHDDYLARYLETGERRIIGIGREVEGLRKDGTVFPMHLAVSAFQDAGRPMFTGIVSDITERQHAAEQLGRADRLASIGTLAAGLGHDMNNVLLPVRARLDALDANPLPETATAHLREIRSAAKYLQDLADGLHLLALNPDDAEAAPRRTDLVTWWEQVQPLLARSLPKHVRLETSWRDDLPAVLIAPHRLTQAVLNLLVNSGTAVGPHGWVRVWATSGDDGHVTLGVTDNGVGMTDEVRRRALDPFFSTKKRGLGTGLGLTLVHGVANAAGGRVEITSTPGSGTTISLVLPTEANAKPATPRAPGALTRISITDARTASLVSRLVEMAGGAVGNGSLAADSKVWITDDLHLDRSVVDQYLAGAGRRLVLLGAASSPWPDMPVDVIPDPHDFDQLRSSIAAAVTTAMEGNPS